jgi:Uroporphyrinogen decarboxylase (URO-D)
MFSDILTPLPALGIEFDVVKGKGPIIASPVRRCAWLLRLSASFDTQRMAHQRHQACKQPLWHRKWMIVVLVQSGRCAANEDAG